MLSSLCLSPRDRQSRQTASVTPNRITGVLDEIWLRMIPNLHRWKIIALNALSHLTNGLMPCFLPWGADVKHPLNWLCTVRTDSVLTGTAKSQQLNVSISLALWAKKIPWQPPACHSREADKWESSHFLTKWTFQGLPESCREDIQPFESDTPIRNAKCHGIKLLSVNLSFCTCRYTSALYAMPV